MPSNYTRIYRFRPPGGMSPDSFKKLLTISSIIIALYVLGFMMRGTNNAIMSLFQFVVLVPIILISLTFHEYSHARVADFLGDPTPRRMGRLTLNPMKHLDPIGALMLFFTSFGWAKPVIVDTRNFRVPKKAMLSVAVAGPLSNLFLAFIGGIIFKLMAYFVASIPQNPTLLLMMYKAAQLFIVINLGLAFFNLLPLPPLDGSRILSFFMPNKYRLQYRRFEEIAPFILIILFVVGGLGPIISPFIAASYDALMAMFSYPNHEFALFLLRMTGGVSV